MKIKAKKNTLLDLQLSKNSISRIQSVNVQLCEVFVDRDMVTDAGRANTCRLKFKAS